MSAEYLQSAEPLGAHIIVTLLERESAAIDAGVVVAEMEERAHVQGLADGTQLLHQRVIETGEMFVLQ